MSNRFLWSRLSFGQALPIRDRVEAVLTFWLRQATSGWRWSTERAAIPLADKPAERMRKRCGVRG